MEYGYYDDPKDVKDLLPLLFKLIESEKDFLMIIEEKKEDEDEVKATKNEQVDGDEEDEGKKKEEVQEEGATAGGKKKSEEDQEEGTTAGGKKKGEEDQEEGATTGGKKKSKEVTEKDNKKFKAGGRYAYKEEYCYYYEIKHQ